MDFNFHLIICQIRIKMSQVNMDQFMLYFFELLFFCKDGIDHDRVFPIFSDRECLDPCR